MPFTDPVADGSTIQFAGIRALKSGGSMKNTLYMVREFRKEDSTTPIVLMGYFNPIMAYGTDHFMKDAYDAGIDGLIIVDLPPEEASEIKDSAQSCNIDIIRLITPTTDQKRLPTILENASGFLYYVSITGVTGTNSADLSTVTTHIDQIKTQTDMPIAIGFGIKTPQDACNIAKIADAVVVGSALIETLINTHETQGIEPVTQQISTLANALKP